MSQNLTTFTKIILGPGHVIEDKEPMPVVMRKTKLKPPVIDSVPDEIKPVDSDTHKK